MHSPSMMRMMGVGILMTLFALAGAADDFEIDFSTNVNTAVSRWSYRYKADRVRDGNYTLLGAYTNNYLGTTAGVSGWWDGVNTLPCVGKNLSGAAITKFSPGIGINESSVHPGSGKLVVVSWRAPESGTVTIQYRFKDQDNGGGDGIVGYVALEATDLASNVVANGGDSGLQTISNQAVTAGQRLHFIVDPTAGTYSYDSTRIYASVVWPWVRTDPASNLQRTSVDLNGYLLNTGGTDTAVWVFYGPADGGTNASAWATNTILAAPQAVGAKTGAACAVSGERGERDEGRGGIEA